MSIAIQDRQAAPVLPLGPEQEPGEPKQQLGQVEELDRVPPELLLPEGLTREACRILEKASKPALKIKLGSTEFETAKKAFHDAALALDRSITSCIADGSALYLGWSAKRATVRGAVKSEAEVKGQCAACGKAYKRAYGPEHNLCRTCSEKAGHTKRRAKAA